MYDMRTLGDDIQNQVKTVCFYHWNTLVIKEFRKYDNSPKVFSSVIVYRLNFLYTCIKNIGKKAQGRFIIYL